MLSKRTAIECWNVLKYEVESVIDQFVPEKKTRKMCHLSKEAIPKIAYKQTIGGFIGIPEWMKIAQITKRHLMELQLKLDNLKETMSKN